MLLLLWLRLRVDEGECEVVLAAVGLRGCCCGVGGIVGG